jgi:hypothetical protein
MPEFIETQADPPRESMDRQLLLSLSLSPLAAGINTIVGFIVAHWIVIVAYKRAGCAVTASCFILCVAAAGLAWNVQRKLAGNDETFPGDARRLFMVKLALLLSALCAVVVLAGTLVLVTLRPGD